VVGERSDSNELRDLALGGVVGGESGLKLLHSLTLDSGIGRELSDDRLWPLDGGVNGLIRLKLEGKPAGPSGDDVGEAGKSAIVMGFRRALLVPPLAALALAFGFGVAGGARGAVVVPFLPEPSFAWDLTWTFLLNCTRCLRAA
jgi:hypothetical protein